MQNKQIQHKYEGMVKDLSKSQLQSNYYFEGKNIRIIATDSESTNSITNEKGNSLIFQIPIPVINYITKVITYENKTLGYTTNEIDYIGQSGIQYIIGHANSKNYILLFTTDNNGFDCIWKVNYQTYDITLLYLRNLGFSTNNPIQAINNFENTKIDKVYWVDGKNQTRFINIEHSIDNDDVEELIDIPINVIDMVGKFNLTQPVITNISPGGTHTSGTIQYAYNLYRVNSSQTKLSSLSEMVSLDKFDAGGGKLNEIVGASPIILINNLDLSYTNIKVYSIKYTSYNELPIISLIDDRQIPSSGFIELYDDGRTISTVSIDEFLFLGSDVIIPEHINTKFNRMFFANYKEINFNVDLDCKAYSFNNTGTSIVYDNLYLDGVTPNGTPLFITTDADYDNPLLKKHDAVNLSYDTYKYQKNGSTIGGEGKYLKYELTQDTVYNKRNKYFKDSEIYRLGIYFYNSYGQSSDPNWIADFKSREGNLQGLYNTLKVTLKPEFFTWLNTTTFNSVYDTPVGYKIIIAERTINDKTIVANGLISTMMINDKSTSAQGGDIAIDYSSPEDVDYVRNKSDELPKLPNFLIRNTNQTVQYVNTSPLERNKHLRDMNTNRNAVATEVQRAYFGNVDTSGRLYQYTSMMQLYSPEVLFGETISLTDNTLFRIKGLLKNEDNNAWSKNYELSSNTVSTEFKIIGGISPAYYSSLDIISGDASSMNRGLICQRPISDPNTSTFNMFYRSYGNLEPELGINDSFIPNDNPNKYFIYGKPEITEKGQSGTNYNNDPKYRYINSLESVLTDGSTDWDNDGTFNRKIISINSYGNRCITFVLGESNATSSYERLTPESLFIAEGFTGENYGILGEFVKTDNEIYLGNIYGGNSYEDKKRTNYIEIGNYRKIDSLNPSINISSPGDTYVNNFKFARIVKTDVSIFSQGTMVFEEIVDFITETTVDLKNRSDLSLNSWDSKFQPSDIEYHNYNRVYSQLPNLIQRRNSNYNIKQVDSLNTNIISSKLKSAGEIIDNWTDLSINDVMTLDGKYGSINCLTNFNDEIYALQDSAFAFISINPRIQTQGNDGLSIQLGTGNVLDRYKYISTTSGTLNKWSVVSSPRAIYYYDLLNRSLNMFSDGLTKLSDIKGNHTFFLNNHVLNDLKIDNPLIKKGVSSGYDYINNEVFMTFHQNNKSFTINFNENKQQFISLYDYLPSMYISRGEYFITTDPTISKLYRQYSGEYNKFYEIYYPSYIILNVSPEANLDTVFDNITYKSEVYLNDIDQSDKTLTNVRLYNEYQDSGLIPLVLGRNSNLRRKFRDWNAILPRNQNSRERIRNPWVKLVLQFNNTSNYKLILHDIIVSYSV